WRGISNRARWDGSIWTVSLLATHPLWPISTMPATGALLRVHLPRRAVRAAVAAWCIPPLIFARFLSGCSADTKPYMDCAGRHAPDHLNRETAEEAWSQPE